MSTSSTRLKRSNQGFKSVYLSEIAGNNNVGLLLLLLLLSVTWNAQGKDRESCIFFLKTKYACI